MFFGLECSECCPKCEETRSYGIIFNGNTEYLVPPGSSTGRSDSSCQNKGEFCGASVNGYIRSALLSSACANGFKGQATVFSGAQIDNIGNIAGLNFVKSGDCPSRFDTLFTTETVDAEVVDDGNGMVYLKIPYSASNDASCGPYGVWRATIRWFFTPDTSNPLP